MLSKHERLKREAVVLWALLGCSAAFLMNMADMQSMEPTAWARFAFFLFFSAFMWDFLKDLHKTRATRSNYLKWRSITYELRFIVLFFFCAFLLPYLIPSYLTLRQNVGAYEFGAVIATTLIVILTAVVQAYHRVRTAYVLLSGMRKQR